MRQLLQGAEKLRRGRDKHEINFDGENEGYQWILLGPHNPKRVFFEYFITLIGILDLFVNIYCMYIETSIVWFNMLILPFYIIEMYVGCVSMYFDDTQLVKKISKIIRHYFK